jgi:inner membrane transporter RhtA
LDLKAKFKRWITSFKLQLFGFVFLGEQLLWSQWLALSVIIMASIGCTYTAQKNRKTTV